MAKIVDKKELQLLKVIRGQVFDTMFNHPAWFNVVGKKQQYTCANSIAKRVLGELRANPELVPGVSKTETGHLGIDVTTLSCNDKVR